MLRLRQLQASEQIFNAKIHQPLRSPISMKSIVFEACRCSADTARLADFGCISIEGFLLDAGLLQGLFGLALFFCQLGDFCEVCTGPSSLVFEMALCCLG